MAQGSFWGVDSILFPDHSGRYLRACFTNIAKSYLHLCALFSCVVHYLQVHYLHSLLISQLRKKQSMWFFFLFILLFKLTLFIGLYLNEVSCRLYYILNSVYVTACSPPKFQFPPVTILFTSFNYLVLLPPVSPLITTTLFSETNVCTEGLGWKCCKIWL